MRSFFTLREEGGERRRERERKRERPKDQFVTGREREGREGGRKGGRKGHPQLATIGRAPPHRRPRFHSSGRTGNSLARVPVDAVSI